MTQSSLLVGVVDWRLGIPSITPQMVNTMPHLETFAGQLLSIIPPIYSDEQTVFLQIVVCVFVYYQLQIRVEFSRHTYTFTHTHFSGTPCYGLRENHTERQREREIERPTSVWLFPAAIMLIVVQKKKKTTQ